MLLHKGTETIETERLILRKFKRSDRSAVYNNYASSEITTKYLRWEAHKNERETKRLVSYYTSAYKSEDGYIWAIELKETREVIGAISLSVVNENDSCGGIGYCIGDKFFNKGYATEAAGAVLKFAILRVGFRRIESYHAIENEASGKVMRNIGMKYEGLLREKYVNKNGVYDCKLYAVLAKDLGL